MRQSLSKNSPITDFATFNEDAETWLESLHSSTVDLIVTDPPYESLEKHRAVGTTTRLVKEWFPIVPNARFPALLQEMYRVLKKDRHCYLFCDQETMFVVKPMAEAVGFRFWKGLVWDKVCIGMGYHYRARFEHILFFEKGKRKLADLGISDIITARRIVNGYPTEKPSAVSEVLVRQSTVPGELVIDPFMGSGSVGMAAIQSGRRFLGNDTSPSALALARTRLIAASSVP